MLLFAFQRIQTKIPHVRTHGIFVVVIKWQFASNDQTQPRSLQAFATRCTATRNAA